MLAPQAESYVPHLVRHAVSSLQCCSWVVEVLQELVFVMLYAWMFLQTLHSFRCDLADCLSCSCNNDNNNNNSIITVIIVIVTIIVLIVLIIIYITDRKFSEVFRRRHA